MITGVKVKSQGPAGQFLVQQSKVADTLLTLLVELGHRQAAVSVVEQGSGNGSVTFSLFHHSGQLTREEEEELIRQLAVAASMKDGDIIEVVYF